MIKWRFPSNDYGEQNGINDNGVAIFRGTPLESLAREICQNSLDAARVIGNDENGNEKKAKAIVEFAAYEISTDEIPEKDLLIDIYSRCVKYWGDQETSATKDFFNKALKSIKEKNIPVLRISDFNTTGLLGSQKERGTDWVNLTKSSGVSDKKSTAGGSFGIGKYAPFACSSLSTVFYSTYDSEGVCASQGVARLVTFEREDGENTQGVGYYGEDKNKPVFNQVSFGGVPARTEFGTDIYVLGYTFFAEEEKWKKDIAISILNSFLGALWEEKLEVHVGDLVITKFTLEDMIRKYEKDLLGNTKSYYEALTSNKTEWFEGDIFNLGKVRLGILLGGEDSPRKVAMIRQTGMKIKEMDRISGSIPFSGLMFIDGSKLNEELRKLENPEHTEWQLERSDNKQVSKRILDRIYEYCRDSVLSLAAQGDKEEFDAGGLGDLLPDEFDDDEKNKSESVTDVVKEYEKKVINRPEKEQRQDKDAGEQTSPDVEQDVGKTVEGDTVLGYLDTDGEGHGGEREPYPVDVIDGGNSVVIKPSPQKRINIKPLNLVVICVNKNEGNYLISFTPDKPAMSADVSLNMSAETSNYPAPIVDASLANGTRLSVNGNIISEVQLKAGTNQKLAVKLATSDYCSLEVTISATAE